MVWRLLDFLVKIADQRVPQMTSVILGLMGVGTGMLFLLRPERFSSTPVLRGVIEFIPATLWGLAFVVSGACLINTALVNGRKAFWYCLALARLMWMFTLLSGFGLFSGAGIGLVSLYTAGFGALCDLTAVAAISPWLKGYLNRHVKTVGTKIA
jgi:hypothetical protein